MKKMKPTTRWCEAQISRKTAHEVKEELERMDEIEKDYREWKKEQGPQEPQEPMGTSIRQENKGSDHYKTGGIEPFDLFRAGELLIPGALTSIIRYAFRCRPNAMRSTGDRVADMKKIIHYAEVVKEELEREDRDV